MTDGAVVNSLPSIAKGSSGWRLTHSCPRRHSSEGWNPGGEARGVEGVTGFADGALGCRSCDCHSRSAGMACVNHWIPAFAGMTAGVASQEFGRNGRGVTGCAKLIPTFAIIPAKAHLRLCRRASPQASARKVKKRKCPLRTGGPPLFFLKPAPADSAARSTFPPWRESSWRRKAPACAAVDRP